MSTYRAPLRDMQFVLRELAGVDEIAELPGFGETADVLDAILEEASTFATQVLDPINRTGDVEGCTWNDGAVTTPIGYLVGEPHRGLEYSTAVQVFGGMGYGGMGYIEETGIAQQYRDVKIVSIYEGTTGIQALDLVGRKLIRDMGTAAGAVIKQMTKSAAALDEADSDVRAIKAQLTRGIELLSEASQYIGMNAMSDLNRAFACSVPYLKLWGIVAGGWQMARAAQISAAKIAAGTSDPFYAAKLATARFYADHVLNVALSLHHEIVHGSASVMILSQEQFDLDRQTLVVA